MIELDWSLISESTIESILKEKLIGQLFGGSTSSNSQDEDRIPGILEATPHSGVHKTIGGKMATSLSPIDPLFWLHHCNVDRIWESWAVLHNKAIPIDPLWANHHLKQFYDPVTEGPVSPQCSDVACSEQFRAEYDRLEKPFLNNLPTSPITLEVSFGPGEKITLPPNITSFSADVTSNNASRKDNVVKFAFDFSTEIQRTLGMSSNESRIEQSPHFAAALLLQNIPLPKSATMALHVFLGVPDANVLTPLDHPGYVSSVAFFPDLSHDSNFKTFSFDITSNLLGLRSAGYNISDSIQIILVPFDLLNPRQVVSLESIVPAKVRVVVLR